MYIVLNFKLNFNETTNKLDFYEISMDKDKKIISDFFDISELNSIVKNSYKLGDEIHVYCINDETLQKKLNVSSNKIIYKFQIKSYVEFRILKESSKSESQNQFMLYRFCSTIDNLIEKNKWDKCINGLLDTLDLDSLLSVSEYLEYIPKSSINLPYITNALEKIKNKALIKSFEIDEIDIKKIASLVDINAHLVISRIKIHLYSNITDIDSLEKELDFLIDIWDKNLIKLLYKDYINKLALINCYSEQFDKKDTLKKSELILTKITKCVDLNSDEINEKFNSLFKQNKRLLF